MQEQFGVLQGKIRLDDGGNRLIQVLLLLYAVVALAEEEPLGGVCGLVMVCVWVDFILTGDNLSCFLDSNLCRGVNT